MTGSERFVTVKASVTDEDNPTICLQMIVKDEGETLERAIKSVENVCDEIIIGIDNTSSDESEEIANRYASLVWKFDFNDDFAARRNEGLEKTECDWVIILDGHEYYHEGHDERVKTIITNAHNKTKFKLIGHPVWFEIDKYGNPIFEGGGQRLFKSDIRYKNAQHNFPVLNTAEEKVFYKDIVLVHDKPAAREVERKKQRDNIMPKFMYDQVDKDPDDRRSLFFIAGHHHHIKDWDGCAIHCKNYLERCPCEGVNPKGDPYERFQVVVNYLNCLYALERYDEVFEVAKEAQFLDWRRNDHLIWMGLAAYQQGRKAGQISGAVFFEKAECFFRQALAFKKPSVFTQFFRSGYYSWVPLYHLAYVYIEWNRPEQHLRQALTACEKVLEYRRDDEDIKNLRAFAIERLRDEFPPDVS